MYTPEFHGPIEGYLMNQITKDLWRVANTHDRQDLMQEGVLVFLRCAAKYSIIDTPQHFMALFKTAWAHHLNDLSVKATKARVMVSETHLDPEDGSEWNREAIGETDNAGALTLMVQQAPREVLMVLNLFLNAPQELLDLATKAWTKKGRRNANGNLIINKMLGLPDEADTLGKVNDYFTN
jgi:DNA-directed RNA polymerase specialized sigma24 family protein